LLQARFAGKDCALIFRHFWKIMVLGAAIITKTKIKCCSKKQADTVVKKEKCNTKI
jgi:hypothetical protein